MGDLSEGELAGVVIGSLIVFGYMFFATLCGAIIGYKRKHKQSTVDPEMSSLQHNFQDENTVVHESNGVSEMEMESTEGQSGNDLELENVEIAQTALHESQTQLLSNENED
eukprot:m.242162 g.242162  ORF g.242162 m.242162 type:complete len:111 (+) comp30432_c0_seq1:74-406(+)